MAACVIVQPWFTAVGHPAQSTLNTARALGGDGNFAYLISDPRGGPVESLAVELARFGRVTRYRVPNDSLRIGTVLAIAALLRHRREAPDLRTVLFADAHLAGVAALWPLASRLLPSVRELGVVHLEGPEHLAFKPARRALLSRFLRAPGRRLFLRTEELAAAWRAAFPEVPPGRIDTLPTLEMADGVDAELPVRRDGPPRFGVLGQIRPGKSLEWLVPLFSQNPALGVLRVAGTFTKPAHRVRLDVLRGHPHFDDRFLGEREMLAIAREQDYLVALYEDWDPRMEVATVFLAARAGRPVLVYDAGWAGRIAREYGCGVAVPRTPRPDARALGALPRRDDEAYRALLGGMRRFGAAHGGPARRKQFVARLGLEAR
jgi:glycosyltransferase involved in cell wall biosynthesis